MKEWKYLETIAITLVYWDLVSTKKMSVCDYISQIIENKSFQFQTVVYVVWLVLLTIF